MKLNTPACPQCGKPAIGSCDLVTATAEFNGDPTKGEVEYDGQTKIHWDGQINEHDYDAAVMGDSGVHELLEVCQSILQRFDLEPTDAVFPCSAMRESIRSAVNQAKSRFRVLLGDVMRVQCGDGHMWTTSIDFPEPAEPLPECLQEDHLTTREEESA